MKDETVYIVSGFMRTGTSMMMRALEAGGMETVSRASRDVMRDNYSDEFYSPNEGGLYEIDSKDFMHPEFPNQFKGKLIKALNAGTMKMDVTPALKVVYMTREFEEIRQSYQAFFGDALPITEERYLKNVERNIRSLKNRKDTQLLCFEYKDVINDSQKCFDILKEAGWPISVEQCVFIVDERLYRFRKENLIKGIV